MYPGCQRFFGSFLIPDVDGDVIPWVPETPREGISRTDLWSQGSDVNENGKKAIGLA